MCFIGRMLAINAKRHCASACDLAMPPPAKKPLQEAGAALASRPPPRTPGRRSRPTTWCNNGSGLCMSKGEVAAEGGGLGPERVRGPMAG